MNRSVAFAVLVRIAISLVIGVVGALVINEVAYRLLKDPSTRDQPQRVELVIPNGTAARLANGQKSIGIPAQMAFLVGDLLVVKNEDTVSHQLGPVWVPPLSSGVLQLNEANDFSYHCTFTETQTIGLEVKSPLNNDLRLQGVLTMGLPTSLMIALYSFLVYPIKKRGEMQA